MAFGFGVGAPAGMTQPYNPGGGTAYSVGPPNMGGRGGAYNGVGPAPGGYRPTPQAYQPPQQVVPSGTSPFGGGGGSSYNPNQGGWDWGQQHPWGNNPGNNPGNYAPPGLPSQEMTDRFLPPLFSEPFKHGLEASASVANYAGAALPGASQFQQGLYNPGLNAMEQSFMNSSAYLGGLGLEQGINQINNQYSTTPFHTSKNKMVGDAANQFAAQVMQTGAKMGTDRQAMATQNLGTLWGAPLQAAQMGQESAGGYYNALEKGMYGDTDLQYSMWAGYPIQGSTYMQPT